MGDLFKPQVDSRQPKSQATPLANEMLAFLMQQMGGGPPESPQDKRSRVLGATQGAQGGLGTKIHAFGQALGGGGSSFAGGTPGSEFGTGLSGPTRAAGGNIADFIKNASSMEAFNEMLGPLRKSFERETQKGEASIKESLGATGNRFSTAVSGQTGQHRQERGNALDQIIAQMFQQNQGNLLGAIGQQQAFGQQNLQPFWDFAGLGILPEQTIVSDSAASQWLKAAGGAASSAAAVVGGG